LAVLLNEIVHCLDKLSETITKSIRISNAIHQDQSMIWLNAVGDETSLGDFGGSAEVRVMFDTLEFVKGTEMFCVPKGTEGNRGVCDVFGCRGDSINKNKDHLVL
jgi:hypothetical protein